MGPLYGVDGNRLVEDIVFPRYLVEDILDDRFKPQFAMEGMLLWAVFQKYPHLEFELEKRRHRKAYKVHLKAKMQAIKNERRKLYGVDGNLLVEDLEFSRERVESILYGAFKPSNLLERMFPAVVYKRYPQLLDELRKRRHRKAYRAHLEAKRHLLSLRS